VVRELLKAHQSSLTQNLWFYLGSSSEEVVKLAQKAIVLVYTVKHPESQLKPSEVLAESLQQSLIECIDHWNHHTLLVRWFYNSIAAANL